MDEKSYRRGHNYLTFFMDLDLRRLMFGTEGKDGNTMAAFVADLKAHQGSAEQIRDVCCDMSPAFQAGIRAHLPKAEITLWGSVYKCVSSGEAEGLADEARAALLRPSGASQ